MTSNQEEFTEEEKKTRSLLEKYFSENLLPIFQEHNVSEEDLDICWYVFCHGWQAHKQIIKENDDSQRTD